MNIVLIGSHNQQIARSFSSSSNVYLLGAQPYERLPGYLQHSDIGLLPLSDHPANAGRNPLKLLQYAAAGLTVVAKETSVLGQVQMPFVYLYQAPEELGEVVDKALSSKIDPSIAQAQVISESWNFKADTLLQFTLDALMAKSLK